MWCRIISWVGEGGRHAVPDPAERLYCTQCESETNGSRLLFSRASAAFTCSLSQLNLYRQEVSSVPGGNHWHTSTHRLFDPFSPSVRQRRKKRQPKKKKTSITGIWRWYRRVLQVTAQLCCCSLMKRSLSTASNHVHTLLAFTEAAPNSGLKVREAVKREHGVDRWQLKIITVSF